MSCTGRWILNITVRNKMEGKRERRKNLVPCLWWWYHVAQSCPTLCDPMDCSPPGSSVHGLLQARILEWLAISSSRGTSLPRDWAHVSCIGRRDSLPLSHQGSPWVCVCAYIYIYACAHTHMLKLIKMYTLKIHLYLHSPKLINPLTVSQGVWGVCVCICLCVRVCACTWEMPGLSLLYVHRAIGSLFLINLFWFFGLFFKGL